MAKMQARVDEIRALQCAGVTEQGLLAVQDQVASLQVVDEGETQFERMVTENDERIRAMAVHQGRLREAHAELAAEVYNDRQEAFQLRMELLEEHTATMLQVHDAHEEAMARLQEMSSAMMAQLELQQEALVRQQSVTAALEVRLEEQRSELNVVRENQQAVLARQEDKDCAERRMPIGQSCRLQHGKGKGDKRKVGEVEKDAMDDMAAKIAELKAEVANLRSRQPIEGAFVEVAPTEQQHNVSELRSPEDENDSTPILRSKAVCGSVGVSIISGNHLVLLTFTRRPKEMYEALLSSPLAARVTAAGANPQPEWGGGKLILAVGVTEASVRGVCRAWHVAVWSADEGEVKATLRAALGRGFPRVKQSGGRMLLPREMECLAAEHEEVS